MVVQCLICTYLYRKPIGSFFYAPQVSRCYCEHVEAAVRPGGKNIPGDQAARLCIMNFIATMNTKKVVSDNKNPSVWFLSDIQS